jgi:hypothetical protein
VVNCLSRSVGLEFFITAAAAFFGAPLQAPHCTKVLLILVLGILDYPVGLCFFPLLIAFTARPTDIKVSFIQSKGRFRVGCLN